MNGLREFDRAAHFFTNRGEQERRPGAWRLESRRNQILPLKPEDRALECFSERAGMEAERSDRFCI